MKERSALRWLRPYFPALVMMILLSVVFASGSPQFLTLRNFINILDQTAPMCILAIGLTFVVLCGNLDLSGGAVIAMVSVICGILLKRGLPVPAVYLLALLLGAGIGLLNGICVALLGISSFVLTIATQIMVRGGAMAISGGRTIYGLPEAFLLPGMGRILNVPVSIPALALLFLLSELVLRRTVFGYRIYAVGEDPKGAGRAGVKSHLVQIECFVLAGVFYAFAAIILTGQLGAVVSSGAEGMEMTALSCLAIGGISLSGGQGNMIGTFLGCLIIGILSSGINMLNLSPYYTNVVRGMVIFGALLMEAVRILLQRYREREKNG